MIHQSFAFLVKCNSHTPCDVFGLELKSTLMYREAGSSASFNGNEIKAFRIGYNELRKGGDFLVEINRNKHNHTNK